MSKIISAVQENCLRIQLFRAVRTVRHGNRSLAVTATHEKESPIAPRGSQIAASRPATVPVRRGLASSRISPGRQLPARGTSACPSNYSPSGASYLRRRWCCTGWCTGTASSAESAAREASTRLESLSASLRARSAAAMPSAP
jgi:hypothetical protein